MAAVRVILRQCEESKTVKRVIHTASISAASPLKDKDDGAGAAGYKDFISESCWTPLDVDYHLRSPHFDVSNYRLSLIPIISLIFSFKILSFFTLSQSH